MKRYISAAYSLKDVKIQGDQQEVINQLYEINPEIFNGVSRVTAWLDTYYKNKYDQDVACVQFYYGKRKGGQYTVPLAATEDDLYEIAEDIYGLEYSMRYNRLKELKQTQNLASGGKVKLSANALVSRLIKDKFGLSSSRDNSGRNAGWVYYVTDKSDPDEYDRFYEEDFLSFIEEVKAQYPDLYIQSGLSGGYGPMLKVYGPDYAWDKATRTATVLK